MTSRPSTPRDATHPALNTPTLAIAWLAEQGAHPWLVRHHELVVEAAVEILDGLGRGLGVEVVRSQVLMGAALHDAGKMIHAAEMSEPGERHESAGETLLIAAGFDEVIARCAVTHARWNDPRASLEDRLVALADKLWKGKRDEALEAAIVEELATGRTRWEVFDVFDAVCEAIAARGPERLTRSSV